MNIQTQKSITVPGSKAIPNEDAIIIHDNIFIVLDGATGLGDKKIASESSDAKWFVDYISDYFDLNWTPKKQFIPTLKKAIIKANNTFKKIANISHDVRTYELPSAGVVAIHVFKNHINAYRIGDCSLYMKKENTVVDVFGDSPLNALDDKSTKKLYNALKRGLSYNEAREEIKGLLQKNRSKMNKKDGYAVLNTEPSSIQGFEKKRIAINQYTELLLTSDGFSAFHEKYNYTLNDFFQAIRKTSLEIMVQKLRDIELKDKYLLKYPRLKPSDDASCIFLGLK